MVGDDRVKTGGWQAGKQPMAEAMWQVFLYNPRTGSRSGKTIFSKEKNRLRKKKFSTVFGAYQWMISVFQSLKEKGLKNRF